MISDPSLLVNNLRSSWYTGHDGFETQKILTKILQSIIQQGGFKRVVFFGASAGGFASLYFSSLFEGSIAVVLQPQTDIRSHLSYYSNNFELYERYFRTLWPSALPSEEWSQKACVNLCDWYSIKRNNSVIYIQSTGDYRHVKTQMVPFLSAVASTGSWNVITSVGYWGELGHKRIPREHYYPWLQASFSSPSIDISDILTTHHNLVDHKRFEIRQMKTDEVTHNLQDLNLSNLILDYQLRQIKN